MTQTKMEPLYFRLVSDEVVGDCVKALIMAKQDSAGVLEVVIQQSKRKRSLSQNRLYWQWVHQWAKKYGWSDKRTHHFFKYKFLVTIFYKADEQYAGMCDAVKALKDIEHESYNKIAAHVIRQTSTTDASTAQMTEYLDKVYRYCYAQGVMLVVPDDLKWIR